MKKRNAVEKKSLYVNRYPYFMYLNQRGDRYGEGSWGTTVPLRRTVAGSQGEFQAGRPRGNGIDK